MMPRCPTCGGVDRHPYTCVGNQWRALAREAGHARARGSRAIADQLRVLARESRDRLLSGGIPF